MNEERKRNLFPQFPVILQKEFLDGYGILPGAVLALIIGLITLVISGYFMWSRLITYNDEKKEVGLSNPIKAQIRIAQQELQDKTDGFIQLNHAIVQFINTQRRLQAGCKPTPPAPDEQVEKRFTARDSLEIEVQNGQQLGYLNKEIGNTIQKVVNKDRQYPDVCSKDFPSEAAWDRDFRNIRELMDKSIQADGDNLRSLSQNS